MKKQFLILGIVYVALSLGIVGCSVASDDSYYERHAKDYTPLPDVEINYSMDIEKNKQNANKTQNNIQLKDNYFQDESNKIKNPNDRAQKN